MGPKDWCPWKILNKIPAERRPKVDMCTWDHENHLRLLGTANLSRDEILARAAEVTRLFPRISQKIVEMPLPKMTFGQQYPGYDKHPGVAVRYGDDITPIIWVNDRIQTALNRISTHWLSLDKEGQEFFRALKGSNPFFQAQSDRFAFIEMWTSKDLPAQAIDAAKMLAAYIGLELEILPGTDLGYGLVLRHKADPEGRVSSVEILEGDVVLAEITHSGREFGEIELEDLILEGDESKVPQWREAANRAHRMGLWDDPQDTRYSRNRVVV